MILACKMQFGVAWSLLGLGNIVICTSFHKLWKYWILKIALNVIVFNRIAFGGRFFKILLLIRLIPGALLFFVFLIIILISCVAVVGTE